jgi:ribosomal protein L31
VGLREGRIVEADVIPEAGARDEDVRGPPGRVAANTTELSGRQVRQLEGKCEQLCSRFATRKTQIAKIVCRNWNPHNMVLDWNWNVRIAEFCHSFWTDEENTSEVRNRQVNEIWFGVPC